MLVTGVSVYFVILLQYFPVPKLFNWVNLRKSLIYFRGIFIQNKNSIPSVL